jgi:hypothetical protein
VDINQKERAGLKKQPRVQQLAVVEVVEVVEVVALLQE